MATSEEVQKSAPDTLDGLNPPTAGVAEGVGADHEGLGAVGVPMAEGGGPLSPLSGAYLLIILSEPISDEHKAKMLQKIKQGNKSVLQNTLVLK